VTASQWSVKAQSAHVALTPASMFALCWRSGSVVVKRYRDGLLHGGSRRRCRRLSNAPRESRVPCGHSASLLAFTDALFGEKIKPQAKETELRMRFKAR
jgi:hypothetical protein